MTARERPIIFSGPMVRAILDGRKTQTRRVIKEKHRAGSMASQMRFQLCPYGQPGDRLWVRETWGLHDQGFDTSEESSFPIYRADTDRPEPARWRSSIHMPREACRLVLEVTDLRFELLQDISEADAIAEGINVIRIGSGYHDRYTAVDRSWSDAIEQDPDIHATAHAAYRELWTSIKSAESWNDNPWVWVIKFARVQS